ncbi:hypothetical protein ABPG74_019479 [Tetrahymena malaccensis]
MLTKLFILIIIPIILAFLSAISSQLVALYYKNIYINQYCDNLFQNQVKISSATTQYISYRLSKEIYKFPFYLNIINSFSQKVINGQVRYNPKHHPALVNYILVYLQQENKELIQMAEKNPFLVDGWYQQNETHINNLDNYGQIIIQNYTQINLIIKSIALQNFIIAKNHDFERIPYQSVFYATEKEGFLFAGYSNTSLSNLIEQSNQQGKYQYDPRNRFWYRNSLNQTSFFMNSPNLSYGQNIPYMSQFGCQKLMFYNPATNKIENHHVQCIEAMISNISNYAESIIKSSKQYYIIDPRTLSIIYNSKKVQNQIQLNQLDNFFNVELEYLQDQKQSQYFKQMINENYNKWVFNASKNFTTFKQMVNQSQFQVTFDYKRNSSVYKVMINPVIGYDDIPKYISQYTNQNGQQLEYVYLQINMISNEDLRAKTDSLIQLSSFLFIPALVFIVVIGIFLVIVNFQFITFTKKQIYNPIIKLICVLKKITLLKKYCNIKEIIVEFEKNSEKIFPSHETNLLYKIFYDLFQQLQYLTEHFFIENPGKTLIDLSKKVNFFKRFKNYYAVGIAHNNIGNILLNQQHHFQSLEHFEQSIIYAKYEIQEFCEKIDDPALLKILQPYCFGDFQKNKQDQINQPQSIIKKASSMSIYQNFDKNTDNTNTKQISHLSQFGNQRNTKSNKQQKKNHRFTADSQILKEDYLSNPEIFYLDNLLIDEKQKKENPSCKILINNQKKSDSEKEEEYLEFQELLQNLFFRKLNYITALIVFQQTLDANKNQTQQYNFWVQIKQLNKELVQLSSHLPSSESIQAICQCIFSKCNFNMFKFKKAEQTFQKSKQIIKSQQERLNKFRIQKQEDTEEKSKLETLLAKQKLLLNQKNVESEKQIILNDFNIKKQTRKETFDSYQNQIMSPLSQNHKNSPLIQNYNSYQSSNIFPLSDRINQGFSQHFFIKKNSQQFDQNLKKGNIENNNHSRISETNQTNRVNFNQQNDSNKYKLSLLNLPANNLYEYIQFNYAEFLIFTKQYKKAAYILTTLLEKGRCLMSNMPYRIIYKLKQIFDLFGIKDNSIIEQQQRFNKDKKITVVISFEMQIQAENMTNRQFNQQGKHESEIDDFIGKQVQLYKRIVDEILVDKEDRISVYLCDLNINYLQQFMTLIQVNQLNSIKKCILTQLNNLIIQNKLCKQKRLSQHKCLLQYYKEIYPRNTFLHNNSFEYFESNSNIQFTEQQVDFQENIQLNQTKDSQNFHFISSYKNQQTNVRNIKNILVEDLNKNQILQNDIQNSQSSLNSSFSQDNLDLKQDQILTDNQMGCQNSKIKENLQMNKQIVSNATSTKMPKDNEKILHIQSNKTLNTQINLNLMENEGKKQIKQDILKDNQIFYNQINNQVLGLEADQKSVEINNSFHNFVRQALNQLLSESISYKFGEYRINCSQESKSYQFQQQSTRNIKLKDCQLNLKLILYQTDSVEIFQNCLFNSLCKLLVTLNIQILIFSNKRGTNFIEKCENQTFIFDSQEIIKIFYSIEKIIQYLYYKRDQFSSYAYLSYIQHY